MAYGTPASEDDIEPYLTHIKKGRKPSTAEIEDLKRRYRAVGAHSPLLAITANQTSKLEAALNSKGIKAPVYFGMKHWYPYIADTVPKILKLGTRRLVGLVLSPHYSRVGVGEYKTILQRSVANSQIKVEFIDSWHNNSLLHQAIGEKISDALVKLPTNTKTHVLFTAHSIPERIITEGDPYSSQLLDSCKAVAKLTGLERWSLAYQSASHTADKWLGPDILDALVSLDKPVNVLVVPIGFVTDHLEILYDIDIEAQTFAKSREINLRRTDSLNTSPTFIAALADVISTRIRKQSMSELT